MPADDFIDHAVTTISGHIDCEIVLSRSLAGEGFCPATDTLASAFTMHDPAVVGKNHYQTASDVHELLARFRAVMDEERVEHVETTRLHLTAMRQMLTRLQTKPSGAGR